MVSVKKNRAKINYAVDVIIGLGFLIAAVSGFVLLAAGASGGYQGGRNPRYAAEIIGLGRDTWKILHNWSSIIMTIGVAGHLVLHGNWIICMTRRLLKRKNQTPKEMTTCTT